MEGRNPKSDKAARDRVRAARFLTAGSAVPHAAAGRGNVLLQDEGRGTISVCVAVFRAMMRDGLLTMRDGRVQLSAEGHDFASRAKATGDPFGEQHREVELATVATADGPETVRVNRNESPLGQLARRRTKCGEPFLSAREFRSGERLRSDYTRGRIMPRLGANWQAVVATRKRAGDAGGMVELTDAALSARQRVDDALAAVGPELAGILVDVCCFLKGLEQVEAERGWPARSAKVLLKTALVALGRHYQPPASEERSQRPILHWGAADYRPRATGARG